MSELAELFLTIYLLFALLAFVIDAAGSYATRRFLPDFPQELMLKKLTRALRDPWVVFQYMKIAVVMFINGFYGVKPKIESTITRQVVVKPGLSGAELSHLTSSTGCSCACAGCMTAHRHDTPHWEKRT
jgi:hypothetical protein